VAFGLIPQLREFLRNIYGGKKSTQGLKALLSRDCLTDRLGSDLPGLKVRGLTFLHFQRQGGKRRGQASDLEQAVAWSTPIHQSVPAPDFQSGERASKPA
jgi:hypothetical protein